MRARNTGAGATESVGPAIDAEGDSGKRCTTSQRNKHTTTLPLARTFTGGRTAISVNGDCGKRHATSERSKHTTTLPLARTSGGRVVGRMLVMRRHFHFAEDARNPRGGRRLAVLACGPACYLVCKPFLSVQCLADIAIGVSGDCGKRRTTSQRNKYTTTLPLARTSIRRAHRNQRKRRQR